MERRTALLRTVSDAGWAIAAAGGVLVGLGVLHPVLALAGVIGVQAVVALGARSLGGWLRQVPPRTLGAGLACRSCEAWVERVRRAPIRVAIATRLTPREHWWACVAAGVGGVGRFWIGAVIAWAVWGAWQIGVAAVFVAWAAPRSFGVIGVAGVILASLLGLALPGSLLALVTEAGRERLRVAFGRAVRREYWPAWVQYAPLTPLFVRLSLRHGPTAFTCCNPGISGGGGVIGESKKEILDAFGDSPQILAAELIAPDADAAARARTLSRAMERRPELGGFPIILKPDAGQRGFAVKLVRSAAEAEAYFHKVRSRVIAQRYHPGPKECGVLWARSPEPDGSGLTGRIFSVTRKEFPVVVGDGRRTLEQLIHAHPRFHRQAAVFLERFAAERGRVLTEGERLRLAHSGNHCQGTLFSDGADLISPELERAIDRLARGFKGGLDIGRFDIRYESDQALRRGEGFAIVELNGTMGESTNIYDPERSIFWAYSVLGAQWKLLYELGAARRCAGARPLSVLEIWRELRRHVRERSGPAVAD